EVAIQRFFVKHRPRQAEALDASHNQAKLRRTRSIWLFSVIIDSRLLEHISDASMKFWAGVALHVER
ncbi:MAG: hypothetical protein ACXVPC_08780, partial [Tumebacillaceae bacterium]